MPEFNSGNPRSHRVLQRRREEGRDEAGDLPGDQGPVSAQVKSIRRRPEARAAHRSTLCRSSGVSRRAGCAGQKPALASSRTMRVRPAQPALLTHDRGEERSLEIQAALARVGRGGCPCS
jgi:hypothetical protein